VRGISISLVFCILCIAFDTRASGPSLNTGATREPAKVVFVCEHGSVKSLVAMEHFNRRARERGLPFQAVARGVAPDLAVPEVVRAGLGSDGFEASDFVPQLLTASDVDHAALVVSFDQDVENLVAGKAPHLVWNGLPGVLADYPRGRAAIVARVNSLLDELASSNSP
jgi:hypothetical protein